ncbi:MULTISPECIES: tRNA uracil 4-sulfurtransferase ThiI [Bacillaceae]|uniref:tRNA uracil 4-sulfurtransferase ThiI n=1 Tax=Bacillaceae TaxID=186817 RepID=UPI001E644A30|nr:MULTISPECIES: tRNA uracil 4-sulfurtransferase ThiI [Bacillaceae]MCE4051163.1 tRNA 4-thiouridine(8) synthase ThiI [Bacillus sp. Au-Bac7]MCM3029840.1 tRNA 4-thiouridine(8) synthase ThiI [Niallia sp. MER 6]MDL0436694.1 tRNA uracil 4-sulfurtransferase ThiI [Niallia sp. SS-2023]UPO86865.1 tRNA 4-thiouridine(8) synthase ThiI [Niallia sp. Man26]
MKYDRILIRYGELSTKGKNRKKFVDKLRHSIADALSSFPNIKIDGQRDRMYVILNGTEAEAVVHSLRNIFGIQSFSPAIKVDRDLDLLKDTALELVSSIYKDGNTFKVSARRSDKTFSLDTNELNHFFGSHILKNIPGIKVDVKNPDITLQVEVRSEAVYLSSENFAGAGGLPSGASGKAVLMLSGGLDSPVAGYLSMKRGLELEGVHFFSPPFTSERAKQKVVDIGNVLASMNGRFVLHIVPFTEIQQLIHKQIPENYTMTATRRLMLRITDEIRRRQEALAIITGESLGQVASQTLESMYAINAVTNTPIIRPLVASDKGDIVDIAKSIGTYDISIRPYEDCCTVFVPASPKTKPKKEKVEFYESFVDFEPMIKEAVDKVETIILTGKQEENSLLDSLF